jgi:hypothetical protein
MNPRAPIRSEAVGVRHRATPAQPPLAPSAFHQSSTSRRAPHPLLSTVLPVTPGVLQALGCFQATSPLRATMESYGNNWAGFPGEFH